MKNKTTYIMLGVGLLLQVLTYLMTKDTLLSFVSGISGVFAVVFCSERKFSYCFWSFLQLTTFSIICFNENLYGKLVENAFYLITMGFSIGIWLAHKDKTENNKVETRSMNRFKMLLTSGVLMFVFSVFYIIMINTDNTQPLLDSLTTSLGLCAQILMMLRYKENWILWMIADILCVVLFISTGNWCMVAQYVFWTLNTVYGYSQWNKSSLAR